MDFSSAAIAIVGAGPGGLILARKLQLLGAAVSIFEGEASRDSRPQGGTLDMHPASGRRALQESGLDAAFLALARPEDQGQRILDQTGRIWLDDQDDDDRPEIDREALRGLLLDSLEPGTLRWNHKLIRAERAESGATLHFANGNAQQFDLVVGADGAWSRVRPLLSSATPEYGGVTFIETWIPDVNTRFPALSALVGRGGMGAIGGGGKSLLAQRNGNGLLRVYAALSVPQDWAAHSLAGLGEEATRTLLLGEFAEFAPELLALIEHAEAPFTPRPIFALPVGHRWAPRPGLTLLGDAAHLMSPFSGMGANLAMQDGLELALALTEEATLEAALARYETPMFERAERAAKAAAEGMERRFSPNALERTLAFFEEHFSKAQPETKPSGAQV